MKQPKLRFVTQKAIEELTRDLNLEYDLDDYQDWEFIVGKPEDVEKYIKHYNSETNDDNKFALMEIIIQATEEQKAEKDFVKYSEITRNLLSENFKLHEYSIFYWSCFDNNNLEDCWRVTPYMRSLWKKCNVG
ncbi:MAG: hypothetical protein M0D53_01880 [Flavobacterium sp. JAD_PAG50586_2]|nr:MAG: hypothetical protein M0D53_01880 [Flavobacterium sp. JAD_PAG50586_2]